MKAIETTYKGYRMRSRLEARWAVFFDSLGIEWQYETEGFDLDGTYYLPDFWLPKQLCWIEVKGQEPTSEEIEKCLKLSQMKINRGGNLPDTRFPVYMLIGQMPLPPEDPGRVILCCAVGYDEDYAWAECPFCGTVDLAFEGVVFCSCENAHAISEIIQEVRSGSPSEHNAWLSRKETHFFSGDDSPRLIAAYTAARSARFEHGEQG